MADTHLSFATPKPMDIFGSHWHNHPTRMRQHCEQIVTEGDLLLIPGDISWAMKRKAAEQDLEFIASFPGTKILCKGNHDYWWDSDKPLNYAGLFDTPYSLPGKELGIAGTRGWVPTVTTMSPDEKASNNIIILREKRRLTRRLEAIADCDCKIVMVHYPPIEEFRDIFAKYDVSTILYGHLHLGGSQYPLSEDWHGVKCLCVAADRINFTPRLIKTLNV
jgi:predicted phosphohydrolase